MSNYFYISGYWIDDHTEFKDYIVKSNNEVDFNQEDDDIFCYGLSEHDIRAAIKRGEDTAFEFVITSYEPLNQPSDETEV